MGPPLWRNNTVPIADKTCLRALLRASTTTHNFDTNNFESKQMFNQETQAGPMLSNAVKNLPVCI